MTGLGEGGDMNVNQDGHCPGWHSIPSPLITSWKLHLFRKLLGWVVLPTVLWLSPLNTEGVVHMGFVVDWVELGQFSVWLRQFFVPVIIPEMLHNRLTSRGSRVGRSPIWVCINLVVQTKFDQTELYSAALPATFFSLQASSGNHSATDPRGTGGLSRG
jgi:hypothetical protein